METKSVEVSLQEARFIASVFSQLTTKVLDPEAVKSAQTAQAIIAKLSAAFPAEKKEPQETDHPNDNAPQA